MLDGDPKTRYSATDCLNHNWFKMNQVSVKDPNKESLNPNILKNILKYKSVSVLRRKAMNVLVKMLNSREITEIRKQFEKIDTDNSGSIEAAELTQALERVGFSITAENINKIFEEVDIDKNQKIN